MVIGIRKLTNEEFLGRMSELNSNIEILSEYKKSNIHVKCKCKIDGFEWDSLPGNLLSGKGCKMCHFRYLREIKLKSHNQFVQEMYDINNNIEIIGNYSGTSNKIKCRCVIHNEEFFTTPHHLLNGQTSCKECISLKNHQSGLKTHDQFLKDLYLVNKDIVVIGKYDGAKKKIKVQCKKCGHTWEPEASSLLCGYGCPGCTFSKGEEKIKSYLIEHNIIFERQKKFVDLKGVGGMPLPYDFYLPAYNLLIEYQGEFHDGTAKIQTEDGLKRQQKNDLRKKEYTTKHNIIFLEIWYYDFDNIENILFNYINNLKNPVTTTVA